MNSNMTVERAATLGRRNVLGLAVAAVRMVAMVRDDWGKRAFRLEPPPSGTSDPAGWAVVDTPFLYRSGWEIYTEPLKRG